MSKKVFPMGFWNYVDCGVLDIPSHADDWKELGMTYAMSCEYRSSEDERYIRESLDAAHARGMKMIVCDYRTHWRYYIEHGEKAYRTAVAQAIEDFGNHPAFYAFHVGDEPCKEDWAAMLESIAIVNEKSNAFLNFIPLFDEDFEERIGVKKEGYAELLIQAVKKTGLRLICYDCYTQCFYHNREYGLHNYFDNLNCFKYVAEACGIPMWTTLLSVGHWAFRCPTEDDLRWQLSTAVAHGADGVLWFYLYQRYLESSFRLSAYDLYYQKTETYRMLLRENRIFHEYYAEKLLNAKLTRVSHYGKIYSNTREYKDGDIPEFTFKCEFSGELIISEFSSPDGDFLLVVNNKQEDIEHIVGELNGKSFNKWLAPGQLIMLAK